MNVKDRMIIEEFRKERPNFTALGDIAHELLQKLVRDAGIQVLGIEHRVKSEQSLAGKLALNGDYYQNLDDLTDLLGARVICFFEDEVDRVGKLVEQAFTIDWENSSDKRALIQADVFGYLSLHYIVSLPDGAGYPAELLGKRFEIQIRTNLQHTWAAINHDLGYKSEFGVPRVVAREFARAAGLLEIVDEEFVRIRNRMSAYTQEVRQQITENRADHVLIDRISLREYVQRNPLMQALNQELAGFSGAEIDLIDPEPYVEQLRWLGKETLGDLQAMLEENRELALALAKPVFTSSGLDILSSNVGLRFLCRAELCRHYPAERAADFLILSLRDRKRAERQAKSLFNQYAKWTRLREEARYQAALDFASQKHESQLRTGGAPYITHPVAVAETVRDWGCGMDHQITALFHDLLEDTDATEAEIEALGGADVLRAVKLLTKPKNYVMADYIAGILTDPMAKTVKAADRLHNLRSAVQTSDDTFKRKYIRETREWFMDFHPDIPPALRALEESLESSEIQPEKGI